MLLKIGIGVITSKIMAIYVGPAGLALVGNLRNLLTSLESLSTLGFQNGVVREVAARQKDGRGYSDLLRTSAICVLGMALILSVVLYFYSVSLSAYYFGSTAYDSVIRLLAAALPWYAASILLTSVINGLGRYRQVIWISICGNLVSLLLTLVLVTQYQTTGALMTVVLAPALLFVVTIFFLWRDLKLGMFGRGTFSVSALKSLLAFSLMAIVSSVISPYVFVLIRNEVIDVAGITAAGYWEAISRISSYYMMFVTAILSVYFLPKLSAAHDDQETSAMIHSYFKGIIPLFGCSLMVLYFLRDYLIRVLFTSDFDPISDLFAWQLSADILKGSSLILGYTLVARRAVTVFIITEFISMAVLFVGSLLLLPGFGVKGVVIAYFITYAVYLVILLIYYRRFVFRSIKTGEI